jgi:hypothetical protein
MRTAGIGIGVLVAIAGGIWILQGLNVAFAPRSFMTSDPTWVAVGAAAVIAGVAVAAWSARRPRQ